MIFTKTQVCWFDGLLVYAPAIIIWQHLGPRSSSEDWDFLKSGPQGHVTIVIRKSTHRGVEVPPPTVERGTVQSYFLQE
jgi:hypothetical protein